MTRTSGKICRTRYFALAIAILAALPIASAAPPAAPTADPDLQAGFPVQTLHDGNGAMFHSGPAIHTLVGNIDDTPDLEIIVSGIGVGPLYAWKANGTPVPGWPVSDLPRVSYPALGVLQGLPGKLDVVASYFGSSPSVHSAYSGAGVRLPGWPRNGANYVSTPPSMADIDGDGRDEMFVCEEDFFVHMYRYDGTSTVVADSTTQACHTPALADLDGDGKLEIITTSDPDTLGTTLNVYHANGFGVAGFPIRIAWSGAATDSFPVVGDVDGDGILDIVVVVGEDNYPWRPVAKIIGGDGAIKREIVGAGILRYGTAPALADLDGDGVPEIIFQADGALNVVRGDGTPLPGWPVVWSTDGTTASAGNSSPVVGDVDGDWLPDIVVTTHTLGGTPGVGEVRVYNRNGVSHPRFPKTLNIGEGAVPAIADIDLDGRNEIIVTGTFWNGVADFYDKVWVYDLGGADHGPVHWGQFGGGPGHRGLYTLHRPGERNAPPTANAGPDRSVAARQSVTLDGSGSVDVDGTIVRASWKQISGTSVPLSNANTLVAQFTAPGLKGTAQETLVFQLTVTDNNGATASDQALVTVHR